MGRRHRPDRRGLHRSGIHSEISKEDGREGSTGRVKPAAGTLTRLGLSCRGIHPASPRSMRSKLSGGTPRSLPPSGTCAPTPATILGLRFMAGPRVAQHDVENPQQLVRGGDDGALAAEAEKLIGVGMADGIDFEAVETAARRVALEVMDSASTAPACRCARAKRWAESANRPRGLGVTDRVSAPYSRVAPISCAAPITSAVTSRRNWLRSREGVTSGMGAAGS